MANTGFKIANADLSDVYLTYEALTAYYPELAGGAKRQSITIVHSNVSTTTQTTVDSVFSGWRNGAYIKTDGTAWIWGSNSFGELGDGTTVANSFPVKVISTGRWITICAGQNHTVGLKSDSTLWAWGSNGNYVLGLSSFAERRSSPVQVVASTGWRFVSAGTSGAAAIKTDGTLWTWGSGTYGNLGQNATTNVSQPAQITGGGTNWKFALARNGGMAAIKTDGTLWGWGYNANGELGDNTTTDKSSPVQTIAGGNNWKQIVCSAELAPTGGSMIALKTDGTMWAWGKGQTQTVSYGSSPVQIMSHNRWVSVYGSGAWLGKTYARDVTGQITQWTSNNTSQSDRSILPPVAGSQWMQFAASGNHYIGVTDTSVGV